MILKELILFSSPVGILILILTFIGFRLREKALGILGLCIAMFYLAMLRVIGSLFTYRETEDIGRGLFATITLFPFAYSMIIMLKAAYAGKKVSNGMKCFGLFLFLFPIMYFVIVLIIAYASMGYRGP